MKNQRKSSIAQRQENVGWLYIIPWIIGFLLMQIYPLCSSLYYSFTDYNILQAPGWVGLENYIKMFTADNEFWGCVKVTCVYVIIMVPVKLAFALFIAMLLNIKIKGIGFFRTVYYLPSILGGSVAVTTIWKKIFSLDGVINGMIKAIGLEPVQWLGDGNIAIVVVCLMGVWQFGSSMIIFLAGLKNVPGYLYEAARVEGCSTTKAFFKITVPMITPMILFNLVMQMIGAFQDFTAPFLITNGGPGRATYVYALKIYEEAFKYLHMGYAAALSWVLFVVLVVLTIVVFVTSNKWVFYADGGGSV